MPEEVAASLAAADAVNEAQIAQERTARVNGIVDALYKAQKGFGTDEGMVYSALQQLRSDREWSEVQVQFKEKYPKFAKHGLLQSLRQELAEEEMEKCKLMLKGNGVAWDVLLDTNVCESLYVAMQGLGTDEDSIYRSLEIVPTQSKWFAVQRAFRQWHKEMCGGDLLAAMREELSVKEQRKCADILRKKDIQCWKEAPTDSTEMFNEDPDDFEGAVIAFGRVEYVCLEDDKQIDLDILRRGEPDEPITVRWRTINKTMEDRCYVEGGGIATIEPQHFRTTITVRFKDNNWWNPERSLWAELSIIEGNARPGELWRTLIVVLNEDSWPANAYGTIDIMTPFALPSLPPTRSSVMNLVKRSLPPFQTNTCPTSTI